MKIKQGLLLVFLMIAAPAPAYAGAIIIDGTDANEHGYVLSDGNHGGWLYMQRALEALAARVPADGVHLVVDLTTRLGPARTAIQSAFDLSSLNRDGWTIKHLNSEQEIDSWLTQISVENTSILYIPTFGLLKGDLTPEEMAKINAHAQAIDRFCNGVNGQDGKGALFAMGESGEGAWDWLFTLLPGIKVTDFHDQGIETAIVPTEEGRHALPNLSDAELGFAKPWHNSFKGDFSTLQTLGTAPGLAPDQLNPLASGQPDEKIIIADKVTLANLSISSSALPNPVQAGSTITYSITITNQGPNTATQAEAIIKFNPLVGLISCDPPEACSGTGGKQIAPLGSLPPGASVMLRVRASVDCAVADGSELAIQVAVNSLTPDPMADNVRVDSTMISAPTTLRLERSELDFGTFKGRARRKLGFTTQSLMITNTGLCPQPVTFELLLRTGSDVDSKRITTPNFGDCSKNEGLPNPGDCKFFTITDPDEPVKKITIGAASLMVPAGKMQIYDVMFKPVIPAFTDQTACDTPRSDQKICLSSDMVLPKDMKSVLNLSLNRTTSKSVTLTAQIEPRARLIDPVVTLEHAGNEYTVVGAVYDSAPEDVKKVIYTFRNGSTVIENCEVDVEGAISQALQRGELIRGQSFKIRQRGLPVLSKKIATNVLVTVVGGSPSSGSASSSSATAVPQSAKNSRITTVEIKSVGLESSCKMANQKRNP